MAFPTKILLPDNKVMTIAGALRVTRTPRWFYGNMRRDVVSAGKLGNAHQPVVMETGAQTEAEPKLTIQNYLGAAGADINIIGTTHPLFTIEENALGAFNYKKSGTSFVEAGFQGAGEGASAVPAAFSDIPAQAIKDGAVTMKAKADTQDAKFDECDDLNHVGSRPDPVLRDMFEYWDSATQPGIAFSSFHGSTLDSPDITLPSNVPVTVGQLIDTNGLVGYFVGDPAQLVVMAVKHVVEQVDGTSVSERHSTTITVSVPASATTSLGGATVPLLFLGSNLIAAHTLDGSFAIGGEIALII